MKTFTFSLLALLLAGTAASVWFGHSRFDGLCDDYAHAAGQGAPPAVPSPQPSSSPPMRGSAGRQEVVLRIAPWPARAMEELSFTLDLPGYGGKEPPRILLEMQGMDMGKNEVVPARGADGAWRGRGTYVACMSGRLDRVARVVLPGGGEASFPFRLAR